MSGTKLTEHLFSDSLPILFLIPVLKISLLISAYSSTEKKKPNLFQKASPDRLQAASTERKSSCFFWHICINISGYVSIIYAYSYPYSLWDKLLKGWKQAPTEVVNLLTQTRVKAMFSLIIHCSICWLHTTQPSYRYLQWVVVAAPRRREQGGRDKAEKVHT